MDLQHYGWVTHPARGLRGPWGTSLESVLPLSLASFYLGQRDRCSQRQLAGPPSLPFLGIALEEQAQASQQQSATLSVFGFRLEQAKEAFKGGASVSRYKVLS